MALDFNAIIDDDEISIEFSNKTSAINIVNSKDTNIVKGGDNSIYFLIKGDKLVYVGKTLNGRRRHDDKDFDKYIIVSAPKGIDVSFLEHHYIQLAKNRNTTLVNGVSPVRPQYISPNDEKRAQAFIMDVYVILEKFGFDLFEERTKKYNKNRPLNTNEKFKEYKNNKIITIGGRITTIYVDDVLYGGNMKEKLREIAKDAGVDYSKWARYKLSGTVHFASELMKHLP